MEEWGDVWLDTSEFGLSQPRLRPFATASRWVTPISCSSSSPGFVSILTINCHSTGNAITPRQKAIGLALAVVPSYLRARLTPQISSWADDPLPRGKLDLLNIWHLRKEQYSPARQRFVASWRRVAWELVERGEKLVAVAGLVNFLVFLYNGR